MLSLGLIGCGAVVHENYTKTLVGREAYGVRYVCDTNATQAAWAASAFGAEIASLEEVAELADAIIISTPPSSHASLARACLRPGKLIICEKPYMTSYQDAIEICEQSQAQGAHIYVGHFRRAFPQLKLARELVMLGVVGEVNSFVVSEGGRFTWKAVSNYTTQDPNGGVLWDTGSHTLDMALFASCLDGSPDISVHGVQVERDKPEPSHDFRANFTLSAEGRDIDGRIHVSRREALPNFVKITGSRGQVAFVTDMDDRVRLTTATGSMVIHAERSYLDLMECLDVQLRAILLTDHAEPFTAENFVGQVKLIEALANA
jgi:predicted dehydrogenase